MIAYKLIYHCNYTAHILLIFIMGNECKNMGEAVVNDPQKFMVDNVDEDRVDPSLSINLKTKGVVP